MAAQYIFQMQGLTKAWPGGKKVFENIWLSFYPDAKIGVVGVNGSGKSTLLKIMAGIDNEFTGEAKAFDGIKRGYLEQEPDLDEQLDVWGNAMRATVRFEVETGSVARPSGSLGSRHRLGDLALVEPGRVNRRVDEDQVLVAAL